MQFDPVLLAPRMGPMKAQGFWRDETIEVYFQKACSGFQNKPRWSITARARTSRCD